jgi:xanthine dehydrogenase accessory factor
VKFDDYLEQVRLLQEKKKDFVCVTLVHAQGSAPQELGARCLISDGAPIFGTVGGGKVENHAIQKSVELLKEIDNPLKTFFEKINLQKDLGMSCGGEVSLFYEIFKSSAVWNIVVFGAGHVAQELVPMLLKLDARVTCIDNREEWLSKLPSSHKLIKIKKEKMEEAVAELDPNSFICIMTMGHSTDLPILKEVMKRNFPYVGNMGSDTKAKKIRLELEEAGYTKENILKLHCPIGENIGRNTPVEISFSVISELLKVRG